MDKCISIEDFRRRKAERRCQDEPRSVALSMADVVGRNFGTLTDGVYGLLRLREILEAHAGLDPEWQTMVLLLLAELHARAEGREHPERLSVCCMGLKSYVESLLMPSNRVELGGAVVLLDLLEKSSPPGIGPSDILQ